MFRFIFLIVLTLIPPQYHSLGFDFSSLLDSDNSTGEAKTFQQLCQYFCDEGDYSDDLLDELFDESRPRLGCWICHKKGFTTKKPTSMTETPTTSTTPASTKMITTTTTTPTATTPTTTTNSTTPTTPTTTTGSTTKGTTKRYFVRSLTDEKVSQ